MHYTFINNGFPSEADYSDQSVQDIFLPLLKHLQQLQKDKGRRILVYLAAPPAAAAATFPAIDTHPPPLVICET